MPVVILLKGQFAEKVFDSNKFPIWYKQFCNVCPVPNLNSYTSVFAASFPNKLDSPKVAHIEREENTACFKVTLSE